jgi:Tol biopolymer transport system component
MMNADGSNVIALTPKVVVAHHGCIYNPSFTPNGKRIVFVEQRCHNEIRCHRTIRSMNVDGRDRRPILGSSPCSRTEGTTCMPPTFRRTDEPFSSSW